MYFLSTLINNVNIDSTKLKIKVTIPITSYNIGVKMKTKHNDVSPITKNVINTTCSNDNSKLRTLMYSTPVELL